MTTIFYFLKTKNARLKNPTDLLHKNLNKWNSWFRISYPGVSLSFCACRRSVVFFSRAFLVSVMKESKKRRRKQPGKLMPKSLSQPVNLPGAQPLMNPLIIQDNLDHGASLAEEQMNPLWVRIHQFLWYTMTSVRVFKKNLSRRQNFRTRWWRYNSSQRHDRGVGVYRSVPLLEDSQNLDL